MTTIIRRRKLGMSSVKGIVQFSETGIRWARSDRPLPDDPLYIRWGCTSDVPAKKVLNTAKAIHEVNDKREFRKVLDEAELCPVTYIDMNEIINAEGGLGVEFPLVVRPAKHAQGRHLYVVETIHEFKRIVQIPAMRNGWYASELINKVAEYRVAVVQGRTVWVAQKTPGNPDDVAWNVAKGGRFDNVRWSDWPLKVVRVAIEAFNLSELDFGGVDVMVDAEGEVFVLEIISAPSLTSPYRQECFAKAFDYIIEYDKKRIPLIKKRGGYTKFIHPALEPKAKVVEEKVNE